MKCSRLSLNLLAMLLLSLQSLHLTHIECAENNTIVVPPTASPEDLELQENDREVQKTLRLLHEGDSQLTLDPSHRNLILVVGSEGVGKTTISKFLTGNNSELVSYWTGDRHLIRDQQGDIRSDTSLDDPTMSEVIRNTTLTPKPKPLIPLLYTDPLTNDTFYEIPSIGIDPGQYSPAQEIANAIFLKKLTDHAQSVKILFIVNYNSLRSGEDHSKLRTLFEHTAHWIKNISHFENSLALIASKVEISQSGRRIIDGISAFLSKILSNIPAFMNYRLPSPHDLHSDPQVTHRARENFSSVTHDQNQKCQQLTHLIQIILNNSSSFVDGSSRSLRSHPRIGFFRQPQEEGLLSQLPEIQSLKPTLQNLIQNLNFPPISRQPLFNFASLSENAEIMLYQVSQKLNDTILDHFAEFKEHVLSQIDLRSDDVNVDGGKKLTILEEELKIIKNMRLRLEGSTNEENFFDLLQSNVGHLRSTEQIQNTVDTDNVNVTGRSLSMGNDTTREAGAEDLKNVSSKLAGILKNLSTTTIHLKYLCQIPLTLASQNNTSGYVRINFQQHKWLGPLREAEGFLDSEIQDLVNMTRKGQRGNMSEQLSSRSTEKKFNWKNFDTGFLFAALAPAEYLAKKGLTKYIRRLRQEKMRIAEAASAIPLEDRIKQRQDSQQESRSNPKKVPTGQQQQQQKKPRMSMKDIPVSELIKLSKFKNKVKNRKG